MSPAQPSADAQSSASASAPPSMPISKAIRAAVAEYMTLVKSNSPYAVQKQAWERLLALNVTGERVWGTVLLQTAKHEGTTL